MAYALTSTIAAPFIGVLCDRYGRRPVILISLAAYVLACSGYLFAATAWQMSALRGLAGVFTAGLVPAMMSIVGDLAPQGRRGQWIGIVSGGASAGWILGPLLGGVLYDRFGYVMPFAASIVMAAGALLLAVLMIQETYQPGIYPGQPRLAWKTVWQALPARQTFLLLMFISFGVMFAWAFIEPQFMFYAYKELIWTSSQLGLVMSIYGAAFMVGEFALGQLSDRLGRKPVLVLGLVLFSAQFVGLVLFHQTIWIAASFLLAGLGNALYDPALNALVLDITPPEQTGGMLGLKATAGSLGNLLGPGLVVLFSPLVSPQGIFLMAASLVLIITLASSYGLRQPKSSKDPHPLFKTADMR